MGLSAHHGVVITYDDYISQAKLTQLTPPPEKAPSVDSGIGLDEYNYPAKLQGVVVTVPRRRFVHRPKGTRMLAPTAETCGNAYRDFVLYPPGYKPKSDWSSAAKDRSKDRSQTENPSDSVKAETILGVEKSSNSENLGSIGAQTPQKPKPPRLPTPDIPEVDESTWWAK